MLPIPHRTPLRSRRKRLQLIQTAIRFKDLGIQLDAHEFTETASASLCTLLSLTRVRSRVRSQEEALATRLDGGHERLAVLLSLQNGQAVEVRLDSADQELYTMSHDE